MPDKRTDGPGALSNEILEQAGQSGTAATGKDGGAMTEMIPIKLIPAPGGILEAVTLAQAEAKRLRSKRGQLAKALSAILDVISQEISCPGLVVKQCQFGDLKACSIKYKPRAECQKQFRKCWARYVLGLEANNDR